LPQPLPGDADAGAALIGKKSVWFEQRLLPTRLYQREKLRPGNRFVGPAVVFQYDTTTVIPPAWEAVVDSFSNLILATTSTSDSIGR
jgi:N-methylhydantoinase A